MEILKHVSYKTKNVCSRQIEYDIMKDGTIHNLEFIGGCPGNLSAMSKLCEGHNAQEIATLLQGNKCRERGTSCADQLSKSIIEALNQK